MTTDTEAAARRAPFTVAWRDAFSIHVPQVDAEHRHLFRLVGALSLETVDTTIEELLDYVAVHFTNEQALMERHGYPEYREHLALHEQFAQRVAEMVSADSGWTDDRVQTLRSFLNKWLIGHILMHDLRFGRWLQARQGHAPTNAPPPAPVVPARTPGFFARLFGRGR